MDCNWLLINNGTCIQWCYVEFDASRSGSWTLTFPITHIWPYRIVAQSCGAGSFFGFNLNNWTDSTVTFGWWGNASSDTIWGIQLITVGKCS